jgi:hypothetical protein
MRLLVACSLVLLLVQAQAQTGTDSASAGTQAALAEPVGSELQRIERERARVHAVWLDEQKACRQGFWVNDCLKDAQARHRLSLAQLKRQQVQIEQALSQQRSQAAFERVQDKLQTQNQRSAGASIEPAQSSVAQAAEREAQARERVLRQQQRTEAAQLRQQQRERQAATRQRADEAGAVPAVAP